MLHWLAGQKPSEGPSDPDATGYVEPPETPAPVFAVRAFKQAIFGTPQTVQPKTRRHSNNENPRQRPNGSRPERPGMIRPLSAGDVNGGAKDDEAYAGDPVSSPTKGILMTPGTAAARRKTVTFGDHVNENEEKRLLKSGIPDDCPGKFPSPFVKAGAMEEEEHAEKGRGRSKLTEALEQARDESTKRKRSDRRAKGTDDADGDVVKTHPEPNSESGKYWKTQYEVYRENSQREVRKLIAKQKMAKSFAKEKDFQCTELADKLRQEQKKVARLEKKTAELEAQLMEMQNRLSNREALERKPVSEVVTTKPELGTRRSYRSEPSKAVLGAGEAAATQQASRHPQRDLVHPIGVQQQPGARTEQTKPQEQPQNATTKARPVNIRTKTSDDIWNLSFEPSSPILSRSAEQPPASPRPGRSVTSGTLATPLKSLSINTLSTNKLARRDSAQPSPPSDRFAKEPLIRQEVLPSPKAEEKRKDSPVLSPGLPQPTPEPQSVKRREVPRSPLQRKPDPAEAVDEMSIQVPASNPFEPNPILSPPAADGKRSYFERRDQPIVKASGSPIAKENVSPPSKPNPAVESVKPMAAWNAINAPAAGKRIASITDKTGKEVGLDRIEAAKARLAARGRNMS
ncbi:hypothetical protein LTR85_007024 [Meristemomyces frigidus]|nr:hypothetical protein LTR85_007024 [Meristemomyces frigidus]